MKIPEREIQEDEDELLAGMWASMPARNESADPHGFEDIGKRIRQKLRQRRIFRFGILSGTMAVTAAAILLFRQPAAPALEVYAQLEQMGVTVERPEVRLTADDGMSMTLDSMASIEQQTPGEVALHTASGTQTTLTAQSRLRVEVPAGRQFQLTLADGSQVWLNAGSVLEYPATFGNRAERRVRLAGEAFFEVAHNAEQPFFVELGSEECVRVLGTSFNVNAYTENNRHVTTLVTGEVCYNAGGCEARLTPDQQLCLDCTTGQTAISEVDAAAYGSWKEGWLWFEAEKLPALTTRLCRIYGITIEVDERLRDYAFSGKIRQERGIDYILNMVTETAPIACEVMDGVIRLKYLAKQINATT